MILTPYFVCVRQCTLGAPNEHAQNRKNEQIDDGDETLMYDKLAVTGNGGKASIVSASSNDGFEAE